MIEPLWDKLKWHTRTTSDYAYQLDSIDTALWFGLDLSWLSWISPVYEVFQALKFRWYWSLFTRRIYDDEEPAERYLDKYSFVSPQALHVMSKHPPRRRTTNEFKWIRVDNRKLWQDWWFSSKEHVEFLERNITSIIRQPEIGEISYLRYIELCTSVAWSGVAPNIAKASRSVVLVWIPNYNQKLL